MSQTTEKNTIPMFEEAGDQFNDSPPTFIAKSKRTLSLRWKATIIGILLGTIPVAITGWVAYQLTASSLEKSIRQELETNGAGLRDRTTRFMLQRIGDIELLGNLPLLTDPKATPEQKKSYLDFFIKAYSVYDSVALINTKGEILVESGTPLNNFNFSKSDYFIASRNLKRPVLAIPRKSTITGKFGIFLAAPLFDNAQQLLGVVRTRIPLEDLEKDIFKAKGQDYQDFLVDYKGKIFSTSNIGANQSLRGKTAKSVFQDLKSAVTPDKVTVSEGISKQTGKKILIASTKIVSSPGKAPINWEGIVTIEKDIAYQPLYQLQRTVLLGTLLTAIITAIIAVIISNRFIKPIIGAAEAVEKVGAGDLSVRLEVQGNDEIAVLSANINGMTTRLKDLIEEQKNALQTESQMIVQTALTREQQQAREFIQNRALELLMEIAPLRKGDLSIRATVTEDEIGTIADSYNAVIKSLRKIVLKVQESSTKVATNANVNEDSVQELVMDTAKQTESLQKALAYIQQMTSSIQTVSTSASNAEEVVQKSVKIVQAGDRLMNQTVQGILDIRETVAETTKKVKRLGESSQKISKVVNLISNFAAQTNLLALNASIEAARAGEEGRGFAVVADEVRALARQSATATAEIEQLVASIQAETKDVVLAMEAGTAQVVLGTKLVEKSRQSLNQITQVSTQVSGLVQKISQLAVEQSQSSDVVSHTISEVVENSQETAKGALSVLIAFKELVDVAEDLQTSVSQFKL